MNLQALQYRKTSHLLHFILFLLTAGFWIVPWICFVLYNRSYNQRIDLAVMANDSRTKSTQP